MYDTQPQVVLSYLASGWSLIDFLAVAPFDLLFANLAALRMARTARLARLPRVMRVFRSLRALCALRGIKAARTFSILNNVFALHAALGRLVFLVALVPWLAHTHACVFFAAEAANAGSNVAWYGDALHQVFVAFTTCDQAQSVTRLGYWTSISAVAMGLTFFAAFIGNFASLFEEMDGNTARYEEKRKAWSGFFSTYGSAVGRKLQRQILHAVSRETFERETSARHAELVRSLDSELKQVLKKKLTDAHDARPTRPARELLVELGCIEEI